MSKLCVLCDIVKCFMCCVQYFFSTKDTCLIDIQHNDNYFCVDSDSLEWVLWIFKNIFWYTSQVLWFLTKIMIYIILLGRLKYTFRDTAYQLKDKVTHFILFLVSVQCGIILIYCGYNIYTVRINTGLLDCLHNM